MGAIGKKRPRKKESGGEKKTKGWREDGEKEKGQ